MTTNSGSLDFHVKRDDWSTTRFVEGPEPADLAAGEVLFKVDRFAFTANNISYAAAGEMLRYWDFFPAESGWGRIPVMGFGDVVRSTHPDVREGQRCFGFFPMSRYAVIEPRSAGPKGIYDGAPHRDGIAPVYNNYTPVGGDGLYSVAHEDHLMVLRGLFMTSFLVDDFFAEDDLLGAKTVIVASASSKTAIALAFLVATAGSAKVVGLTSSRNAAFVKSLGYYDEVVLYDDIEAIDAATPSVFVDMAGSGDVTNRVHRHLGDHLKYSMVIGATHWAEGGRDTDLPGPDPTFFMAPNQALKRAQEWGPGGLETRLGDSWFRFRDASEAWLKIERSAGRDAVERVYRATLEGRTSPSEGHVLSLWDA